MRSIITTRVISRYDQYYENIKENQHDHISKIIRNMGNNKKDSEK